MTIIMLLSHQSSWYSTPCKVYSIVELIKYAYTFRQLVKVNDNNYSYLNHFICTKI